jgi:hypothetical protein
VAHLLLFADDAKIFKTINSESDTKLLQSDLNYFHIWCINNGMELNVNKCTTISFSYKKSIIHFDYNLFNSVIQRVFIINDLGVYFDVKLKFNYHIDKIRNRALAKLGFLKRSCSEFSNPHALKNVYNSLVRSNLEYASFIWSPNNSIHTQYLESIQNSFLRFISFKCNVQRPPHSPYDGVLGFFKISTLKTRRNYFNIIFLYKLLQNKIDCPQLLERIHFKINYKNSRNRDPFFINNVKAKYLFSSPANTLMAIGNSTNLDLFYCSINDINYAFNL